MGYTLKSQDENKIHTSIQISGHAADIVKEKITEMKTKTGVKVYGTNLAIQSLLCELYKIKKALI